VHKCAYAEFIRKPVHFIEDADGVKVCGFCHAPEIKPELKAPAKTVRK